MTRVIDVDIAQLVQDDNELKTLLQTLENSLMKIYENIDELENTWEGTAHDIFFEAFIGDYTEMVGRQKVLTRLQETVDYAKQEYQSCEEIVSTEISAISI